MQGTQAGQDGWWQKVHLPIDCPAAVLNHSFRAGRVLPRPDLEILIDSDESHNGEIASQQGWATNDLRVYHRQLGNWPETTFWATWHHTVLVRTGKLALRCSAPGLPIDAAKGLEAI